ncbi:MAG: hypothetical protein RL662_1210 [Bacteroidota bacterium]|jgi:exodeoxyribonuclease VII large subunit
MEKPILSLYELNNRVRGVLDNTFNQHLWIRAEMSDVRVNQNGHCYLEFIEKDSNNRTIIAKARASIWANVFKLLKLYFESETGQTFASGLKVLVQVSIEFHELYGYSLNVHTIDPSYTLGDQARNRSAIIKQLEDEGVLTLNKELEFPQLAQRVAVISSPTAAGYEDFCNQLASNPNGFVFYTHLFPASMQGERTESSIINALDRIFNHIQLFDVVVIIRGGGATSELSSFDSYLLAANCAQFPLPIITGIGHERDDTVLDMVAHKRAKTPTAVAEFLIERAHDLAFTLQTVENNVITLGREYLVEQASHLHNLTTQFSYITRDKTKDELNLLHIFSTKLKGAFKNAIVREFTSLASMPEQLRLGATDFVEKSSNQLISKGQYLELVSPERILKKGYALTIKDNKIVKNVKDIASGDELIIRYHDGDIQVVVE